MADDTHDLQFLHELVRQTDLDPDHDRLGRTVGDALGIPRNEVVGIVRRLEHRGLIEHHQRTRKAGAGIDLVQLIVTPAGYQLVGFGPLAG